MKHLIKNAVKAKYRHSQPVPLLAKGILIAGLLFILMNISGCSEAELIHGQPVSTAIICGYRENSVNPTAYISDEKVKAIMEQITAQNSRINIFNVSGDPLSVKVLTVGKSNAVNQEQIAADRRKISQMIMAHLSEVTANAPEADLFRSIQLAARWLADEPADRPKHLLIIDSGLNTSGILSFTQPDLLRTAPQVIADQLKVRGEIPDLSGVKVTLAGLGNTLAPQMPVNEPQRQKLVALYRTIIQEAGGEAELSQGAYGSDVVETEFPVSLIDLPSEKPLIFSTPLSLGEEQVRFQANKASFADPSAVEQSLTQIASQMKKDPDQVFLLAGTTATWGDPEKSRSLSLKRAEAVRDLLVRLGVNSAQLICKGLGHDQDPFDRVQDLGTDGALIETLAAQNRRVIIVNLEHPTARLIVNKP